MTTNTEILDDRLSRLERDIRALHALAKSDPEAALEQARRDEIGGDAA